MLNLEKSLSALAEEFGRLDFTFHHYHEDGHDYLKNLWPGGKDESVMVCVYRGDSIHEPFHRHDFIYFNYAYEHDYAALSDREGNLVTIHEGECYIGQPFSGYALRSIDGVTSTIIGVLIKKEAFFRNFMQTFASDSTLFHFFLDPEKEKYADKYLHFSFRDVPEVRPLLELMVLEYANRKRNTERLTECGKRTENKEQLAECANQNEDTQQVLTSMATTLYLFVARAFRMKEGLVTNAAEESAKERSAREMLAYVDDHFRSASLKELSDHFSYHPNYISSMLKRETGKTFSEILLEKRMEHAAVLMRGTDLSNEEIADILGYTSTTNYYKAFRRYYGCTPREYAAREGIADDAGREYPLARSHR